MIETHVLLTAVFGTVMVMTLDTTKLNRTTNIRMAWLRVDPWHYQCSLTSELASTNRCLYPGSEAELVRLIVEAAQLRISLVPTDLARVKQIGSIPTRIEMIENGVVDTDTQIYWYTHARQQKYEMSTVVLPTYLAAIASNRPTDIQDFWGTSFSFTQVYSPQMWVLVFVVFGTCRIYVILLLKTTSRTWWSTKGTAAFVTFFIGMIVALYRSGLLARLVMSHQAYTFVDFESMIHALNNHRIHMVANRGQGWLQIVKKAAAEGNPMQVVFEEAMERNPPLFIEDLDIDDIGEYIESGTGVFISEEMQTRYLSSLHCNTRVVPLTQLGYYNAGLLFSKNVSSELLTRINTAINKLQSAFDTIQNRYRHMLERKASKSECESGLRTFELQPLSLTRLLGAFLLLISSFVAGLACLATEAVMPFTANSTRALVRRIL